MPSRIHTIFPVLQTAAPFGSDTPSATMEVTTTEVDQVFTLAEIAANVPTIIAWGDGETSPITTTAGELAHTYAEPGTYTLTFPNAGALSRFVYWDAGLTINSADIRNLSGMQYFAVYEAAGLFSTEDLRGWHPDHFSYNSFESTVILNTRDLVTWNPSYFDMSYVLNMSGHFESSEIAHWRPSSFYFGRHTGDVSIVGTLDLADFADWRPTTFGIYAVKNAGFNYIINSVDVANWRPYSFSIWQLTPALNNLADTTGTIDTADFAGWAVTDDNPDAYSTFALDTLPDTVAVTIDLDHFANFNPGSFYLRGMPHADVTVRTGVISTWSSMAGFYMSAMDLSQAQVDMLLSELYAQAQIKITEAYLEIALQSNASPSGTAQSACPPVTGKEFAYALLNDPCGVIDFPYTSLQYS